MVAWLVLIGVDNKYKKKSQILQFYAILHDAAWFIPEFYHDGYAYCNMLPWNCKSSLLGHLNAIVLSLFMNLKKLQVYLLLEY